jgi:flagellar biosynthesis protein FlhF
MSTLSFQDYVRERMLRRRQAAMAPEAAATTPSRTATPATERSGVLEQRMSERAPAASAPLLRDPPVLREPVNQTRDLAVPSLADVQLASHAAASIASATATAKRDQEDMMSELRSMKGLIEERFGALAFMEKLNRHPAQARLTQKLLDCGFSPALIRKIGDSLAVDVADESAWAAGVLERNLITAEADAPLEDQGGVYALVGATGVGKTTSTAKIAAAFATKYGASNLGLITLDAYRIGAHEQLRAYGRILGVPVHTAHDRASLEDLLELLSAKKMVLIDTAGMAQRDARTRELLDMLSHRSIKKLLVVNAASQGETIEDVMISYHASVCAGIVLSKMDEAVKLGPALDALIRMKLKVVGVANGQRVPEDWHRLSANALVHRALRSGGSSAYKLDASEVSLIFTAPVSRTPASTHATPVARTRLDGAVLHA